MSAGVANATADSLVAIMDAMNVSLEAAGANYRAVLAEYVTSGDDGVAGGTVSTLPRCLPEDGCLDRSLGNKALGSDFVPFDDRRTWSGPANGPTDNITYAIDETGDAVPFAGGLTAAQTDAAIVRAMESWEDVSCSGLGLVRNSARNALTGAAIDIGFRAGRNSFIFADIQHAGWRDLEFAGGVLGVTFTFIFGENVGTPPVFVPSDIDNNGKDDVAFREIYYDPFRFFDPTFVLPAVPWSWADNGVANIDVESVALHEAGHGLSQAHFGFIRFKNDGETLKATPRAVMNAIYGGPFRSLVGPDNGGHCANWSSWPNK